MERSGVGALRPGGQPLGAAHDRLPHPPLPPDPPTAGRKAVRGGGAVGGGAGPGLLLRSVLVILL